MSEEMLTINDIDLYIEKLKYFEGFIDTIYADNLGYITAGAGHLVSDTKKFSDISNNDIYFSFRNNPSKKASIDDVRTEYNRVDGIVKSKKKTGSLATTGWKQYTSGSKIYYNEMVIKLLLTADVRKKEQELISALKIYNKSHTNKIDYASLPCDAKLALLDLIFNAGINHFLNFKNLLSAVAKKDWATAAKESHRSLPSGKSNDDRNKWVYDLLSGCR